ncbi:cytochrome P450 [Chondromyces apiculatus]|uniref:Cytochrome P450 n=1 Tax=Chondromyces apiculatus DSM 436 TaxID=1192034 RepID=A0A017TIF7_9BACT|nr:cytochrome P450 [Chondromyces apiculatus]EYF08416.1 cytochrome P450 [Chondromyces apiculatus DSM 436]
MALPPGPRAPAPLTVYNWLSRPFPFLSECRARFGSAFTIRLPALPPLAIFADPDDVKLVFTDDTDSMVAGRFNLSLSAFLGDRSVLMLDGREHLRQRRLLLPPFHGERMHTYGQVMIDAAHGAIDTFPSGKPFALHGFMQEITLHVILRAIFGIEEGPRLSALGKTVAELLEIVSWPPLLIPLMQRDLGPRSPWGRFLRARNEAYGMLHDEIRSRRARGDSSDASLRGQDILSLLLQARDENGNPMTDDELRDELVTLLVAGHETTATALAWAIHWILTTPGVEARLRRELAGGDLSPARIAKLELLDAVVREALRLYPVIPIVGRILDKPAHVGGFDLPAGVAVVCSIYLAHRRPEAYPEPERFNPDRFLGKKLSPYEFFPFGGGIRRCIGMAFALQEMKMVLATVLSRTTLRPADDGPVRPVRRSITLTPSGGCRVIMTRRAPRPSLTSSTSPTQTAAAPSETSSPAATAPAVTA